MRWKSPWWDAHWSVQRTTFYDFSQVGSSLGLQSPCIWLWHYMLTFCLWLPILKTVLECPCHLCMYLCHIIPEGCDASHKCTHNSWRLNRTCRIPTPVRNMESSFQYQPNAFKAHALFRSHIGIVNILGVGECLGLGQKSDMHITELNKEMRGKLLWKRFGSWEKRKERKFG